MHVHLFLDYIPVWGVFFLTILITLVSFELGFQLVRHKKKTLDRSAEGTVGAIVAAILSLLAFILAFTFNSAALRFDERTKLVLEEAIAIEQTYLRAGYFPEPYRHEIRSDLRDYIKVRLEGIHPEKQHVALARSIELQSRLWDYTKEIVEKIPNYNMTPSLVQYVNEIIAVHAKRVMTGAHRRIPQTIWDAVYFLTILAIASMGYYIGIKGHHYFIVNFALMLTFSAVITLIADLDRAQEGSLRVSQQPLIDLYNKIISTNYLKDPA